MKIKSLNNLTDKIDTDLAWRKKELSSILLDVKESNNKHDSEQSKTIRIGIIMLYAHWEGAIKSISKFYLEYVSNLRLKYSELKNNFLAITMKNCLHQLSKTKKTSLHVDVINKIYEQKDVESHIPYKDTIQTESNLNIKVFHEITATIGIDDSPIQLKEHYIDQRLLGNRNKIAHGERFETLEGISNISDYEDLHQTILDIIDKFASKIKDAAANEEYKRTNLI